MNIAPQLSKNTFIIQPTQPLTAMAINYWIMPDVARRLTSTIDRLPEMGSTE
jgi:hypothetical protein